MKKLLCILLSVVLCITFSIGLADTVEQMAEKYKKELEASSQGETIPFSPQATESYSTSTNWISSDVNRATLAILLSFDLALIGYSDPSLGLVNYTSYIGMTNNIYIITGMYENHTFEIYYAPKDHSAVYHVSPTTFSATANKTIQADNMSSICSTYYEINRDYIMAFAAALASQ